MEFCNGAADILVFMQPGREYELLEVQQGLGLNRQTLYNRIKLLEGLGLIETWRERQPPARRLLKLTEKGRQVREYIIKIREILER